jgi:hypothetical protein
MTAGKPRPIAAFYSVETGDWDTAATIPLLVPSRDFVAVKLRWPPQLTRTKFAAGKLVLLAQEPGQHIRSAL